MTVPLGVVGNLEFSFIDQSCRSFDNGTHLIGSTGYTDCGTITREYDRGIEYTNELLKPDFSVSESESEPCPHLKLKITCFLRYGDSEDVQPRARRSVIESRIERTMGCQKDQMYAFGESGLTKQFSSVAVFSKNNQVSELKGPNYCTLKALGYNSEFQNNLENCS